MPLEEEESEGDKSDLDLDSSFFGGVFLGGLSNGKGTL